MVLGSGATVKYVEPRRGVFGGRLMFPREFGGRGDMGRGGLLLRAARSGEELDYVAIEASARLGRASPPQPMG